jgi:hypothetical protein
MFSTPFSTHTRRSFMLAWLAICYRIKSVFSAVPKALSKFVVSQVRPVRADF